MAPFSIAHDGVSPKLILQPELTHCNTNKQAKNKQRIVKKKEEKEKKGMALCSAFPFVFHSLDYSPTWRDLQYCRRIQKCLFAGMKAEKQKMFSSNVHLHIPHSYNITLTVYIYIYIHRKRESARESEHKWGFFLSHPYEFMTKTQCFQCIK